MTKKQRLFEVMGKVNPEFKLIREDINKTKKVRLCEGVDSTKKFTLQLWGQEETLYLTTNQYANNGGLAVQLMSPTEGPYATVSTNMADSGDLPDNEFFMKDWSENQEVAEQLIEKSIVLPTGKQSASGFVIAKSYKINPTYLQGGVEDTQLNEDREEFKRAMVYLIYSKDGDYLGDLDPIDEEQSAYFDNIDDIITTPEFQKFAQENNITPEQVGRVKTERTYTMNGIPLSKEYYAPSESTELYDEQNNVWYNLSGQQMRDPSEYDRGGEGYTPWGDEGYDY